MKKILKSALALVLCLGLFACSSAPNEPAASEERKAEAKYVAGTYTGTGDGFGGSVKVEVTVSDTEITDIKIVEDSETAGRAETDEAKEKVIAAIMESGSNEVDGISQATMTSNAIKEAVGKALEAAKTGEQPTAETESEAGLTYTAGTFNGTGDGYNGPVEVAVTFTEDAISDIEVVDYSYEKEKRYKEILENSEDIRKQIEHFKKQNPFAADFLEKEMGYYVISCTK